MIARPGLAALSCRRCQGAILGAVLGRSTLVRPSLPRALPLQSHVWTLPRKAFSTDHNPATLDIQTKAVSSAVEEELSSDAAEEDVENDGDVEETPWFLDVEPPRHVPDHHKPDLPSTPANAPALVDPMIKYIYEDMGLDDLALLDLRDLDPPAALGPNLIMLLGTARSERHLHICSGRFVRWIRRNHKIDARADGLIGPGELKTKLRRLRRKAKLMGTNSAVVPSGDHGISTGWVCVNFSVNDHEAGESVSFDDSGRFSGFGATQTGTTIVVQCLTERRRKELDLESLWRGILRRSLDQSIGIKERRSMDRAEIDAMVASRIQMPHDPSAEQWDALQRASQQRRNFHTSARRLYPEDQRTDTPVPPGIVEEAAEGEESQSKEIDLTLVREQLRKLHLSGAPLSQEALPHVVRAIFRATSAEGTAPERLMMLNDLLLTAEERGLEIFSSRMLVTLIENLSESPAYGPEMRRAQKNLEYLLRELDVPLDSEQVLALMYVYAQQGDWDKFWDAFCAPPRHKQSRTAEHYELAYRATAATGDVKKCLSVLRWVVPEMMQEQPPIYPVGIVYKSLKDLVHVTDPSAESSLQNPTPTDGMSVIEARKLQHREALGVLKLMEDIRSQIDAVQARSQNENLMNHFMNRVVGNSDPVDQPDPSDRHADQFRGPQKRKAQRPKEKADDVDDKLKEIIQRSRR
ncbi:hypothetical protein S40285_02860 [Stachybotrys chlorohalonatus IBT 40285]|uniref:ATPase synthesis protein 25 n=1 Tax=Stachybotrys chlorohalonatus (strain IBT 40285) TaxID=1283841 RepID=A0A084QLP3_STAC4|nr:hypothetical protein S40285_02860 [Stachybotrys chlorohalonata IBT 40285]